ncbi:Uncharacterized protein SCF082_LOCUS48475 [Durusdinium trenchii]|uniref:Uncharacterized protein n=1 Tax=Durusdinium trenchii TaxID=1381693 RepID=A0ABP0RU44_9DINO
MWAKSGGVKAIFMQRVKILSVTTRSKKIEVTGGFYSEEDMKNELGYSPERIEKVKKWVKSKLALYQKNTLKSKSTLVNLADKIRELAKQDTACKAPVDKLDVIIKELDDSYESMSDMHAEGSATGFSKEPLD